MQIKMTDLEAPDLQALLAHHVAWAREDNCGHALDLTGLSKPAITMFAARDDNGSLMGIAAIKELSVTEGEVKSVRTHADHLRKGVSAALMSYLETVARQRGYQRLLLETHPTEKYAPARALYERRGYVYRQAFADYENDGVSVFMELKL